MENPYLPPISIQLAETLTERIHSDYYRQDVRFPSEAELCIEFKVSRTTVRTALAALVANGLLVKRPGIGSFLTPGSLAGRIGNTPGSPKIALIMSGLLADGGWNTLAYRGLEKCKSKGFQTRFSELVGPDNVRELVGSYIEDGYDFIIGHGWDFSRQFIDLAPQYPDKNFFVTSTWLKGNIPSNLQFFHPPTGYAGYMAGSLAALVSRNHVIGVVCGMDNPLQRDVADGFTQSARVTVPGTTALVVNAGQYNDVRRGRAAALSLIRDGADVIWHAADLTGLGVIGASVEQGVFVIGCYSDQTSMAYTSFLTSICWDLGYVIYNRTLALSAGQFAGGCNWEPPFYEIFHFIAGGSNTPFVNLNVPPDVQNRMKTILDSLQNGYLKPLCANTELPQPIKEVNEPN